MNRWVSWTFTVLLFLLFIEIVIGFPIQIEKPSEKIEISSAKQDLSQSSGAEQKMLGVHLVESRHGNRDWELFSESAEGFQGQAKWELKNVKVLFYSDETVQFTVTGETGSIDNKTKDMIIQGNVELISMNGYRFRSRLLNYTAEKRQIHAPEKVTMLGPAEKRVKGFQLKGQQMTADVDQSLMTISGDVIAEKPFDSGKKAIVKSESAEFSGKSYSAKFLQKVSIEMGAMKMEGPSAEFRYDQNKDFLQSILLSGGVKVSDLDKYATSDQVQFVSAENKFILSGSPRLVQNKDEMVGDKITFIDGGKRVKVENIKARMDKK